MLKNAELSNQLGVKVNDLKFCVCLLLTLVSSSFREPLSTAPDTWNVITVR